MRFQKILSLALMNQWVYNKPKNVKYIHDYYVKTNNERVALFENKEKECILAFRGSYDIKDIEEDLLSEFGNVCENNENFVDSFFDSYNELVELDVDGCNSITLTGHSLGGSMAIIVGAHVFRDSEIVTFGAPKTCCNKRFKRKNILMVENPTDPIISFPVKKSVFHCTKNTFNIKTSKYEHKSKYYPLLPKSLNIENHLLTEYIKYFNESEEYINIYQYYMSF